METFFFFYELSHETHDRQGVHGSLARGDSTQQDACTITALETHRLDLSDLVRPAPLAPCGLGVISAVLADEVLAKQSPVSPLDVHELTSEAKRKTPRTTTQRQRLRSVKKTRV